MKNEKAFTIFCGFRAALGMVDALSVRVNLNRNDDLIIIIPKHFASAFRVYVRANGGFGGLLYRFY